MNEGNNGGEEVAQSVPEIPAPISDKVMYDELMANDPYFKQNETLRENLAAIFRPLESDSESDEAELQKRRLELQMRYDFYQRNKNVADFEQGGVAQDVSEEVLNRLKPSPEQISHAKAEIEKQRAAEAEAQLQAAQVATPESEVEAPPAEDIEQAEREEIADAGEAIAPPDEPIPNVEPQVAMEENESADDGPMFQELFNNDPEFRTDYVFLQQLTVLFDQEEAKTAGAEKIKAARSDLRERYANFVSVKELPNVEPPKPEPPKPEPVPRPEKKPTESKEDKPAEPPKAPPGEADDSERQKKLDDFKKVEKQSMAKDYYLVLGVKRDAEPAEIKRNYMKLQWQVHPDQIERLKPEWKKRATDATTRINLAYEVLSDKVKRQQYDNPVAPPDRSDFQRGSVVSSERAQTQEAKLWDMVEQVFIRGSTYIPGKKERRLAHFEQELSNAPNFMRIAFVLEKMDREGALIQIGDGTGALKISPAELRIRMVKVLRNINQPPAVIDPMMLDLPVQFEIRGKIYKEAQERSQADAWLADLNTSFSKIRAGLQLFAKYDTVVQFPNGRPGLVIKEVFEDFMEILSKQNNYRNKRTNAELRVAFQKLPNWHDIDLKVLWLLDRKIPCPTTLRPRYEKFVQKMPARPS